MINRLLIFALMFLAYVPSGFCDDVVIEGQWPVFRGGRGLGARVSGILTEFKRFWEYQGAVSIESGAAVGFAMVCFVDVAGKLVALDVGTGEEIWNLELGASVVSTPLLLAQNEKKYLCAGDQRGIFHCVDADTGKEIWNYDCGEKIAGSASYFSHDGRVFVVFGAYDFKLHCLDIDTGRELWQMETDNFINGTPALSGNRLVFGGCDSFLRIVSAPEGKLEKAVELESYLPSSPVLEGSTAWAANYNGAVFAVDIDTGRVIWKYQDAYSDAFLAPLALNDSFVVAVARNGRIHVLDRESGKLIRLLVVGGKVTVGPLIDDGRLLVADESGYLTVFDLASGRELARREHGPAVAAPLALCAGRLYVCDESGALTVYKQD